MNTRYHCGKYPHLICSAASMGAIDVCCDECEIAIQENKEHDALMTEKEALEKLQKIINAWEKDENIYSDTMNITIDQETINAIEVVMEATKKRTEELKNWASCDKLPFETVGNLEFDIWNDSERKVVCVRTSTDIHSLLEIGKEYTVANVDVHSWNTDVYLKEFGNISFNSVCFNEIEQKEGNVDG